MKKPLLILSLLLVYAISVAQQANQATIRCHYIEQYIKSGTDPQNMAQDEFILDLGRNGSAFYSVYERAIQLSRDSLLKKGMPADDIMNAQKDMPRTHQQMEIFKHYPQKGRYTLYDKVVKLYRYEDELPKLNWEIAQESKEVAQYKCQKAEAECAGRKWTAWFTTEIPFTDGPWLLTGLPGLILEAYDSEGLFHFTCIEIKNAPQVSVDPPKRQYIRCTHEEYLKARLELHTDPQAALQKATGRKLQIMGPDGKPHKPTETKRNFLEKE